MTRTFDLIVIGSGSASGSVAGPVKGALCLAGSQNGRSVSCRRPEENLDATRGLALGRSLDGAQITHPIEHLGAGGTRGGSRGGSSVRVRPIIVR